jgi:hypothetical protein
MSYHVHLDLPMIPSMRFFKLKLRSHFPFDLFAVHRAQVPDLSHPNNFRRLHKTNVQSEKQIFEDQRKMRRKENSYRFPPPPKILVPYFPQTYMVNMVT